jgi:hypothetical protein
MTVDVRQLEHGTWELSFSTGATVAHVFDYIVDFERHIDWEEELLEVRTLRGSAGAVGAKYLKIYGSRPTGFLQRLFWKPTRIDCKITAVSRPERIAWEVQLWRDQPSEGYYSQDVEVLLRPAGAGSDVRFVRRLMSDDAVSAGIAMGAHNFMTGLFRQVPPEMKDRLREEHRRRYPGKPVPNTFDLSPGEVAGDFLENLPIRGPGSRSLARLKALLDGGGR